MTPWIVGYLLIGSVVWNIVYFTGWRKTGASAGEMIFPAMFCLFAWPVLLFCGACVGIEFVFNEIKPFSWEVPPMRKRAFWLALGMVLMYVAPGYLPLTKAIVLKTMAYCSPGSLEYCIPLGRHVAEAMANPDDWRYDHDGLRHQVIDLWIGPAGEIQIGKTLSVQDRLPNYDRAVISKRAFAIREHLQEHDNARLARQLDPRLKLGEQLAADLRDVP